MDVASQAAARSRSAPCVLPVLLALALLSACAPGEREAALPADPQRDPLATARTFLELVLRPDIPAAQAMLAPDALLTYDDLQWLAAQNAGRTFANVRFLARNSETDRVPNRILWLVSGEETTPLVEQYTREFAQVTVVLIDQRWWVHQLRIRPPHRLRSTPT